MPLDSLLTSWKGNMLTFKIKGTEQSFDVPNDWKEITIERYIRYVDELKKLDDVIEDNVNFYELITKYRQSFNNIFQAYTGIDKSIIDKLSADAVFSIYGTMMENTKPPEPKKIKSFRFKNKTYYLPKSKVDYFGNQVDMSEATFGEVVEAMQVQEMSQTFIDNNFKALPYQIAILCRPKNEDYNDQKVSERAKLFNQLPMSIVWQISFFLIRQKIESFKHIQQSLGQTQSKAQIIID